MILNNYLGVSGFMVMDRCRKRSPMNIVCFASPLNSDHLRSQLDQLRLEADDTRAKANNARMRLMRLSEAAENLQRQAAVSVQSGKENDARELLFQKRKVIQALERSKSRIELLNELSAKLEEAISVRETQLVETAGLDVQLNSEDASSEIRIVSPASDCTGNSTNMRDSDTDILKGTEDQDSKIHVQDQAHMPSSNNLSHVFASFVDPQSEDDKPNIHEVPSAGNGNNVVDGLKDLSSYTDFLEHLDQQMNKIEAELLTFLRFSTLVVEDKDRQENIKVQQTRQILEAVRDIRERITGFMGAKVESR